MCFILIAICLDGYYLLLKFLDLAEILFNVVTSLTQ